MSKRIREKEKHKQEKTQRFSLKAFWAEKKPVLIFVLGFVLLMGIFYAFWITEAFREIILKPVVTLNAWLASKVLNVFGFNTIATGADLASATSGFSVSIMQGCDALEPVAIYTFAVLLFPLPLKTKLPGFAIGIPLLLLLNQLRIISLYIFGVYSPALFKFMHIQGWQVLFILLTLACLAYWIIWGLKKEKLSVSNE